MNISYIPNCNFNPFSKSFIFFHWWLDRAKVHPWQRNYKKLKQHPTFFNSPNKKETQYLLVEIMELALLWLCFRLSSSYRRLYKMLIRILEQDGWCETRGHNTLDLLNGLDISMLIQYPFCITQYLYINATNTWLHPLILIL